MTVYLFHVVTSFIRRFASARSRGLLPRWSRPLRYSFDKERYDRSRATKGRMGISGICCGDRDTNGRPQKAEYRGAQYGGIRGGWFRPSKGGSLSITNNQAEGRRIV